MEDGNSEFGKKMSVVLKEIEDAMWEFEVNSNIPQYSEDGFKAGVKIFMSVMMDSMWKLQEDEEMDIETRTNMSIAMGNEIRNTVKKYTGLDTRELYKK